MRDDGIDTAVASKIALVSSTLAAGQQYQGHINNKDAFGSNRGNTPTMQIQDAYFYTMPLIIVRVATAAYHTMLSSPASQRLAPLSRQTRWRASLVFESQSSLGKRILPAAV